MRNLVKLPLIKGALTYRRMRGPTAMVIVDRRQFGCAGCQLNQLTTSFGEFASMRDAYYCVSLEIGDD
jgi:hypothetical protein